MALLTATKPLDLLSPFYVPGEADARPETISTATIVLRETSGDIVTFTGDFVLIGDVPIGGRIDAVEESGDAIGYAATGLDATLQELGPLVADAAATGNGFPIVAYLLRGADTLVGSAGNDRLVGMDDDDTVLGGSGDDDINGNTGDDIVHGNGGADFARGGQGDDLVYGGNGDDWHVNGNIGDDTVFGDGSQDPGADTIFGGQGNDYLFGDFGAFGRPGGNDRIDGNLGDDRLFGEAGNDTLLGGDGADYLFGEEGDDRLAGGAGNDLFVFADAGGHDRVADFVQGADRLVLAEGLNGLTFTADGLFALFSARMTAQDGDTVIDLGSGNALTVEGILPGQFTAGDFVMLVL
ncbi:hypothetical protein STVA_21560 [Allostella vacuolata]|nr:hypothetical protein STVA_21560 [Stella vacuolata]